MKQLKIHCAVCYFLIVFCLNLSLAEDLVTERIVTEIYKIETRKGVPLDFQYNETITSNGELTSAPGCPKSIDGYPWIYQFHEISPKKFELRCHLLGTYAKCPTGQILFLRSGTNYGVCGCECLKYESTSDSKFYLGINIGKQRLRFFTFCNSSIFVEGQVYDILDKSVCFNIYAQGPCQEGNVLSLSDNFGGFPLKSLACIPECDIRDTDWKRKFKSGECGFIPGRGGSATQLSANDCADGERYSVILKKCLKKNPKRHYVIG